MRLKLNANAIENCFDLPTFQELQVKKFVKREACIENGNILQGIPNYIANENSIIIFIINYKSID